MSAAGSEMGVWAPVMDGVVAEIEKPLGAAESATRVAEVAAKGVFKGLTNRTESANPGKLNKPPAEASLSETGVPPVAGPLETSADATDAEKAEKARLVVVKVTLLRAKERGMSCAEPTPGDGHVAVVALVTVMVVMTDDPNLHVASTVAWRLVPVRVRVVVAADAGQPRGEKLVTAAVEG